MGNMPDLSYMCASMSRAHAAGFPFYGIHIFSAHICRFLVLHLLSNARTPRVQSLSDFDCH